MVYFCKYYFCTEFHVNDPHAPQWARYFVLAPPPMQMQKLPLKLPFCSWTRGSCRGHVYHILMWCVCSRILSIDALYTRCRCDPLTWCCSTDDVCDMWCHASYVYGCGVVMYGDVATLRCPARYSTPIMYLMLYVTTQSGIALTNQVSVFLNPHHSMAV